MIEILEASLPYIKGLWTLPWILVGFAITVLLSKLFGEGKIEKLMKKIGLILLYFFVPFLLFRLLLGIDFNEGEIAFIIVTFIVLCLMYVFAYYFALNSTKKMNLDGNSKKQYIKTVLTNQGRSSAFVGGAMLGIAHWQIYALIYMSVGAIFLFAIIPYILAFLHNKDIKDSKKASKIQALPWYLRMFPWYLLLFAGAAVLIHSTTGVTHRDFGQFSIFFEFFTQLTIPAALYYVGAGIHPRDIKIDELKKLIKLNRGIKDHWPWVRNIFFLTAILTPVLTSIILGILLMMNIIPHEWFSVLVINSILPITSTNMFLVPYGIDKKVTALSVTWTTIICIPIVVTLIAFFHQLF